MVLSSIFTSFIKEPTHWWLIIFNFIVLYGEVQSKFHNKGNYVHAGEKIASVGMLHSGASMLHFEKYAKTHTGPLYRPDNKPYYRREDLVSPTSFLRSLENNYPNFY